MPHDVPKITKKKFYYIIIGKYNSVNRKKYLNLIRVNGINNEDLITFIRILKYFSFHLNLK